MTRAGAFLLAVTLLVFSVSISGEMVSAARPGSEISPYVNLFGSHTNSSTPCVVNNWTLLKENGDQEQFQIPSGKMLVVQDIGFSVTQLTNLSGSTTVALAIKVPPEFPPQDPYPTPYHYFNRAAVNENNAAGDNENMMAGFATTVPFSAEVVRVNDYQVVNGLLYVRIKGILVDAP